MKKIFSFLFFLCCLSANAQFVDDFSDGDFSSNPVWSGDIGNFIINSGELQSDDLGVTGSSYLVASAPTKDSSSWEFYIKLDFAPSTSNYAKVYLAASESDLTGSLDGYYVRVGESGSTDALKLYRQNGTSSTLLITGTSGAVASQPALARVKVTRSNTGDWEMFADYTGGTAYTLEGTANDASHNIGTFMGVYCNYTSSRGNLFFFDDFRVDPLFTDTDAPTLLSVNALDATTIDLRFSEAVSAATVANLSNFTLTGGVAIVSAMIDSSDPSLVHLVLSPAMMSGTTYTLNISGIQDLAGNTMAADSEMFSYVEVGAANPFDVLITELLPDPSPQIGLPNGEFVELYNNSTSAIDLGGFGLASGGTAQTLASFILAPGAYVIVCDDSDLADYSSFGDAIAVTSFASLSNAGDVSTLTDASGTLIHEVEYSLATYRDTDKDDGGYTLEMVNPSLYCQGEGNWSASANANGGTPGTQNSVFNSSPDSEQPNLLSAVALSNSQVRLNFSEIMDTGINNPAYYSINNAAGTVNMVTISTDRLSVDLTISSPFFIDETEYTVSLTAGVTDCSANAVAVNTAMFTYFDTDPATENDVIINEIFADYAPKLGMPSAEFIELYNRSEKVINLGELSFSAGATPQALPSQLLLPGTYVIVCDIDDVSDFNVFGNTAAIAAFPAMSNGGDDLTIFNGSGDIIDAVSFNLDWYNDTSKDDGGWSLELINPSSPCEASSNWAATNNLNGGTPGKVNSVFNENTEAVLPAIIRATIISNTEIQVVFTQSMEAISASNASNYTIDNGISVSAANIVGPSNDKVNLTLSAALEEGTIYTLSGSSNILNCIGSGLGLDDNALFGLSQMPEAGDVVLNEILFYQQSGGSDYVELYNRSNKIINIADLGIARLTDEPQIGEIDVDYFLFPGTYVVITEDANDVRSGFMVANDNALIEIADLPTLPSDEGNVTIFTGGTTDLNVIDAFDYNEDFHYTLLDDLRGVALERIDFNGETQSRSNWQSAAANVGFGTPTAPNSQYFENLGGNGATISFVKTTFSPDGNGMDDVLLMNYEVATTGYSANITIYDANGRLVKSLVRNELLANTGTYKWDGLTDNNDKARIGIYVVFVELYDANGGLENYKETIVLAGQLD